MGPGRPSLFGCVVLSLFLALEKRFRHILLLVGAVRLLRVEQGRIVVEACSAESQSAAVSNHSEHCVMSGVVCGVVKKVGACNSRDYVDVRAAVIF